jgi:hypothetical protein
LLPSSPSLSFSLTWDREIVRLGGGVELFEFAMSCFPCMSYRKVTVYWKCIGPVFPPGHFASPSAVICKAHVGLSVWVFSGDFVFSPTHFCHEATSWGVIGLATSVSSS